MQKITLATILKAFVCARLEFCIVSSQGTFTCLNFCQVRFQFNYATLGASQKVVYYRAM